MVAEVEFEVMGEYAKSLLEEKMEKCFGSVTFF